MHCVTLHTDEGVEVRTAKRVAFAAGHQHQFIRVPRTYPLELVTEGTRIGDAMNAFHHTQPLYLRSIIQQHQTSTMLNGWIPLDALAGKYLPRVAPSCLIQRLRPPALAGAAQFQPAESFIDDFRVAPIGKLVSVARPRVERVRVLPQTGACGRQRELFRAITMRFTSWRLAMSVSIDVRPHSRVSRITSEGYRADNEVIDAFLASPAPLQPSRPSMRHRQAHREAARIPPPQPECP